VQRSTGTKVQEQLHKLVYASAATRIANAERFSLSRTFARADSGHYSTRRNTVCRVLRIAFLFCHYVDGGLLRLCCVAFNCTCARSCGLHRELSFSPRFFVLSCLLPLPFTKLFPPLYPLLFLRMLLVFSFVFTLNLLLPPPSSFSFT
jgi:hypothetical protein